MRKPLTYQKRELDPRAVELLVGLQPQAEHPAEDALDQVGQHGHVAPGGEAASRSPVDPHQSRLEKI